MNRSYVFLANGFEEIEALTVVDVMRRAGLEVQTVSINKDNNVIGAHGVTVVADTNIYAANFEDAEWLIAPGGMPGSQNLHECKKLNDILSSHFKKDGKIAAICAAPALVLSPLGILDGKEATCYPGMENHFRKEVIQKVAHVVKDGNVITANGPATATMFALTIVADTLGKTIAQEIGSGMLCYCQPVNIYL